MSKDKILVPKLFPSGRSREYNQLNSDVISEIVYSWLFTYKGHREIDRDILGLDPNYTKGFTSMGALHYLGLRKKFKAIFYGYELEAAIEILKVDTQDFENIIKLLKNNSFESDDYLLEELSNIAKKNEKDFDKFYQIQLQNITETDIRKSNSFYRKEQRILRALLFRDNNEAQCAICSRIFPVNLLVAAHIKPRSECTISERKNPKIVMPVCKAGCDEFYEKNYLHVDSSGVVKKTHQIGNKSSDLLILLDNLEGLVCTFFNRDTAKFFEYKRHTK